MVKCNNILLSSNCLRGGLFSTNEVNLAYGFCESLLIVKTEVLTHQNERHVKSIAITSLT